MDSLLLMVVAFVGYLVMYRLYGRFVGRKIFALSREAVVPAVQYEDGVDFVPTKKEIIFGHHFTSIAGTGPIVGPAIAIIWGWLPAMIWVFFGSIIMGAVHDFGALILSMRNQGKSVSEFTAKYINPRTKLFFFVVVFLDLLIVTAIFGLVIAVIFNMFPASVLPVWAEVPIAMVLGWMIYKRGGNATWLSIAALVLMYVTVIIGVYAPIKLPAILGMPPTGAWTIALLVYAFIASTLPVTLLLQPRDFINSHQLLVALALMVLGVFAASFASGSGLELVAPAVQADPQGAPSMIPFLFITIACGAISGFHALVSSGTTAKQVRNEQDALFVGYGGMLTEATLSTLVIIAVAAGIGLSYTTKDGASLSGMQAWTTHYASWAASSGLGAKVSAFVVGAANMIEAIGIPHSWAVAIMGVFVASFAGTTMDTATRIERYALTELLGESIPVFNNKYFATIVAVILAGALAFSSGANGAGALALWPLFGCINQILAALVLTTVTVYLRRRGGAAWMISGFPAVFLAAMTLWALFINQGMYMSSGKVLLQIINIVVILVSIWVIIEGLIRFFTITPGEAAGDASTT